MPLTPAPLNDHIPPDPAPLARPSALADLFLTFTWLALQGFGGVLAVAQRELVDRKQWLTREAFLDAYSVAQLLPGPNVVNLALMLGDRFFGWRGALAALAGMLLMPLLIVILLAAGYREFADLPAVAGAFRGMGAVAVGLMLAMAIKMTRPLAKSPLGPARCALLAALTAASIGYFRLPLAWILPVLALLGWSLARATLARQGGRK